MLYHLALSFQKTVSFCNVVHYVSFRSMAALLTSFFMSLLLGQKFINFSAKFFQSGVRPFTPDSHKSKGKTPTMGGCFILFVVLVNIFVWCNLQNSDIWALIATLVGFGLIGFLDDLSKLYCQLGLYPRQKFLMQVVVAMFIAIGWIYFKDPSDVLCVPFLKDFLPSLGYLFIPWIVFILVGTSNAVNLTDGLDGLAIGTLLSTFSVFSVVAYLTGHVAFASYLNIPFAASSEVSIVGGILIGVSMGFLWFNAHPAQIFMGDVGSLSLGATLAMMAIISRQELLLPIAGGMFVLEALSVMSQCIARKYYNTKIFKMAPIHHHFELLGWKEPKITVRFNIISMMLCLIALMTLKLR